LKINPYKLQVDFYPDFIIDFHPILSKAPPNGSQPIFSGWIFT